MVSLKAIKQQSNKYGLSKLLILSPMVLFFALSFVNAFPEQESRSVEEVSFEEIKNECFRFICNIDDMAKMWNWMDSYVASLLKTHLGDYLTIYLNTLEAHKLYLKYEELDWNINEMMKLHLSADE